MAKFVYTTSSYDVCDKYQVCVWDDDGDTDMLGFYCDRYKKTVHNIVKIMTTKMPGKYFFAPAS